MLGLLKFNFSPVRFAALATNFDASMLPHGDQFC